MAETDPDRGSTSPLSPELSDTTGSEFEEEEDPGIDIADLERVYKGLQGPLLWGLPEFNETKMSRHIYRLRDLLHVPHSTWGAVVLRFTLCWLYFKHGEIERSRAELSEIDTLIHTVDWAGDDAALLRRCLEGVEHVLQATWVHLAHRNTPLKDMWYELAQIIPFKDLGAQQQAAIWGLQASCRYCFFEWVGFRFKAAAIKAQELYPREPEWQRIYGDQPTSVVGDAFTPHIAIYGATWHLQKKRPEPARELLRSAFRPVQDPCQAFFYSYLRSPLSRALAAWPENAFVQLNAAVMYAREKSSIRDEEMAETCSAAAVRIAPDCVITNVVRRLVVPSHHAPCLALCETTYGKGVLALLPFLGTGTFSLEVIMRGFFMR